MDPAKGSRREGSGSRVSQGPGASRHPGSAIAPSLNNKDREPSPNPVSRSYQPEKQLLHTSTVRLNVSGSEEEFVSSGNATALYRQKEKRQSREVSRDKDKSPAPLRDALARVKTLLPKTEADAKSNEDTTALQHVASSLERPGSSKAERGEGSVLRSSNVARREEKESGRTTSPTVSPRSTDLSSKSSSDDKDPNVHRSSSKGHGGHHHHHRQHSPKEKKPALSEVLALQDQTEIAKMLKKMYSDSKHKKAKKLSSANARTPLHEAAEAHHLTVFIELIRLKVDGITKTYLGNTPIHLLMSSEAPQGVTAARYLELFRLLSRHNSMMRVLELENHRGETPLFLACVAGNAAAVDALLQSGVDYTSAYMPDIKVPSHAPAFARIQDLVSAARDYQEQIVQRAEPRRGVAVGTNSLLSRLLVVTRRRSANANASAALLASLRASPPGALMAAPLVDTLKDEKKKEPKENLSFSPKDNVLLAIAHSPVDPSTIEMISREFNAAVRSEESWADMQELLLTIDRLAALKEEKGRYFISFASKNELLRCLTDHVVLVNLSDKPFSWEISLFHPALSTWNASTLRFEMLGPRKGVMQPTESVKLTLNLLSTTRVDFAQLFVVTFWEDAPGPDGAAPHKRALYFFTRVLIQPPPDVQDLEVLPADLPPLQPTALIGSGASAQVFKVPNFLRKAEGQFIAVKRFNLNLEAGLEDFKEDYRKFKVELYISCRVSHPNCVRTYGFCGTPPCLIMEYVEMNLRGLIDDASIPLSDVHKAKIAVHIAKGMEYLHAHNVIHRDLKPANVLVTPQYTAKLADFGLSLLQDPNGELRNSPLDGAMDDALEGTLFYMAPELLAGDRRFSTESDVYSYGIVILELYKRFSLIHTLPDAARTTFLKSRKEGRGPAEVSGVGVEEVAQLIRSCWHKDPLSRPNFTAIVNLLLTYRRTMLQLDLDQEFEDAKAEGSLTRMLEDWLSRLSSPDPRASQHFREEMASSKTLARLTEELLANASLGEEEINAIEKLLDGLIGGKCRDLIINLRALQPVFGKLGRPDARAFIVRTVEKSIQGHHSSRGDSLYDSSPLLVQRDVAPADETDHAGVAAFFAFCADAKKDPNFITALGPERYNPERILLDRRTQEAEDEIRRWQSELKRIQKRKAKIQKLPDAVTWVRSNLGMERVAISRDASVKLVSDSNDLKTRVEAMNLDDIDRAKTESLVEKAQAAFNATVDGYAATLASLRARRDALIVIVDNCGATLEECEAVRQPLESLPSEWASLGATLEALKKSAVALVDERRRNNFVRPPGLPSASDPPLEPNTSISVRWVTACISVLLPHAPTPELFYVAASSVDMADLLAKMWEARPDVSTASAHTIAGALNCYLKELAGPVLPQVVTRVLLDAIRMPDNEKRTAIIVAWLQRLPPATVALCRTVCSLVPQLLLHSSKNKLNLARVAGIYGPWLVKLDEDTADSRAQRQALTEFLVVHYDRLLPAAPLEKSQG